MRMTRFSKTAIGISAVALAIGGVACAQAPAAGPGRGDADRTLTRAEEQARAEQQFARMDVNKDGKLDRADREAARTQRREAMFDRLDTNKDGSISKAEFMADRGPDDDRPDGDRPAGDRRGGWHRGGPGMSGPGADHPGARRGPGGPRGGMMGMRKADADGDHAVTQAEFVAAALARFDAMDTDRNGSVTPEERRAAHEKMRAEWEARKSERRGAPDAPPAPAPAPASTQN